MKQWVKLERGNDWGTEYFSLPGKAKSASGTCDHRRGIIFTDGSALRVRWPDGSVTNEKVSNRRMRSTVSDMGHSYDVEYSLAGVFAQWRGLRKWFALDEIEIEQEVK